jgi:hypothetical protein
VLGGSGGGGEPGVTLEALAAQANRSADFAAVFRLVFAAAAAIIAVGLVLLMVMEERPLRGHPSRDPGVPVAAE